MVLLSTLNKNLSTLNKEKTMENTPTVSKVSVALSDVEKRIIEDLKNRHGSNFSSALRVIVREWDEIKNNEVHTYKVLRPGVRHAELPRPARKYKSIPVIEPPVE